MMKPFKVVCIKFVSIPQVPLSEVDQVIPSEIYTVVSVEKIDFHVSGVAFYLKEKPKECRYSSSLFRPISDCGKTICEWIEDTHFKQLEFEEAIKQGDL